MARAAAVVGDTRMNPGLRGDKLRVPTLSAGVLNRPRVTGLIERAAAHPVTVITAPAGAGKTLACAIWAQSAARSSRVARAPPPRADAGAAQPQRGRRPSGEPGGRGPRLWLPDHAGAR